MFKTIKDSKQGLCQQVYDTVFDMLLTLKQPLYFFPPINKQFIMLPVLLVRNKNKKDKNIFFSF